MGEGRFRQDHRRHLDREQVHSCNSLAPCRRDKGQYQTNRHQGRFPESRNDSEEFAEGEVAPVGSNQTGGRQGILEPRTEHPASPIPNPHPPPPPSPPTPPPP